MYFTRVSLFKNPFAQDDGKFKLKFCVGNAVSAVTIITFVCYLKVPPSTAMGNKRVEMNRKRNHVVFLLPLSSLDDHNVTT